MISLNDILVSLDNYFDLDMEEDLWTFAYYYTDVKIDQ
jgi:hypothetical protein